MKPMRNQIFFLSLAPLVLLVIVLCLQDGQADELRNNLAAGVSALDLGMNGYVVGSRLSADQKRTAAANPADQSYAGTYKFRDGELFIVAAENDDTVLALYQRDENAGIERARQMISGLMGLFGEPTAMAHDRLIYWAYNGQGKIAEEQYNASRDKGAPVDVMATVKFSSAFPITEENPDVDPVGTAYFIISSDPLLQDFISR